MVFSVLLGIASLIFICFNPTRHLLYIKKLLLPLACILFIACLIIFPKTAVDAAAKGLNLWANIVFPSLFPFFVVSEVLNSTGFVRAAGVLLEPVMRPLFNVPGCASFAFLMGITSGYPVGAKITTGMRKEKLLAKSEAERLLAFSNNSGPLFIIGAVALGMFKMPQTGIFLLTCHVLASITVGILFRFSGPKRENVRYKYSESLSGKFRAELLYSQQKTNRNLGTVFGNAVSNSIMTLLMIGGFIVLFSVIINLLLNTGIIHGISGAVSVILAPAGINKDIIASIISGIFEITSGVNMAAGALGAPIAQRLAAASVIMGWGGISVHAQVSSIIRDTGLSLKPYLRGKFLQGLIAGIYTLIGLKITGSKIFGSRQAYSPVYDAKIFTRYECLITSCRYLMIFITVLFICTATFWAVKYLKGKSMR